MQGEAPFITLLMAMVNLLHGQSIGPGYNRMLIDDDSSIYVSGRNVIYHFNQTNNAEIASITIGPSNHSEVEVTVMEFVYDNGQTRPSALLYCATPNYDCYSVNLTNVTDVEAIGKKILSKSAVVHLVKQHNGDKYWFVACPHQQAYPDNDNILCSKPGIHLTGNLSPSSNKNFFLKFKQADVNESVQTTRFLAGFTIAKSNMTLLFSIQGTSTETSHITHICQPVGASIKLTYIDMPISCGSDNILTDVKMESSMFVASFTNQQMDGSTICVYSLQDIRTRLEDNKRKCYRDEYKYDNDKNRPLDYFLTDGNRCSQAINVSLLEGSILCSDLPGYIGVIGDLTLEGQPVLTFDDQVIKAVSLAQRQDTVVAFFGSDQQINKAVVYPANKTARKLDTHFAVARPLQKYLLNNGASLFVLTTSELLKFPMAMCGNKTTCQQCLNDGDPDCVWCIMENMCSTSSECKDNYIPLPAKHRAIERCPAISQLQPKIINVNEDSQNLTFQITPTNVTNFRLFCTYQSVEADFSKRVSALQISGTTRLTTCHLPYQNVRDAMDRMKGPLLVKVTITSNVSTASLLESHITYYSCNKFTKCMDCVNANWMCHWCPYSNKCVDRGNNCASTPNTTFTTVDECPSSTEFTFKEAYRGENGTLVVTNDEYRVIISGRNFPQPSTDFRYSCDLTVHEPISFSATYLNTTEVECLLNLTSQTLQTGRYETRLSLKFGTTFIDGSPQHVLVYDCEKLISPAENCGECKSFVFVKPYYQCKWCQDSQGRQGRCRYLNDSCPIENSRCPPPTVTKVWPVSAFVNSTTRVDIDGYNLGSHFNETVNAVTIDELPCMSVEEFYIPSKRISCLVGPSNESRNGPVKVSTLAGMTSGDQHSFEFFFRTPNITIVCPGFGPRSGGTTIQVQGVNLDTGREQEVFIAGTLCEKTDCGNSTCHLARQSSNTLCCKTSGANATMLNQPYRVDVKFDGQPVSTSVIYYSYAPDPVIESISPRTSFQAGGRKLTVTGQNLLAIQDPKIYLKYGNKRTKAQSCTKNETVNRPGEQKIVCPSPILKPNRDRMALRSVLQMRQRQQNTIIAFEMDGVQSVGNLSADIATITYFPNPIIKPFPTTQTYQNILKIEGENLNSATTRNEVIVWIGSIMKCNVTTLERELIYCNPPPHPPVDLKDHAAYFQVEVEIGYFSYKVGFIKYDVDVTSINDDAVKLGVGLSCAVTLIVLLVIAVLVLWKKRKTMHKEKKTMEYKMEKKEAKFREQCRKEFAGLQTAMSDLTSDLAGGSILFRDYSVYAANVLFLNEVDHAILKPPPVMTENSTQAMDTFKGLLRNTQFLLVLIRTLDKDRNFTIHDRSSVASILMAINSDNMEYITEILKTLLNDLVDKNIAAHSEKLLLRRSESVAEKLLTHWLSICLYHHLKERSGSPLFILYKAIKIQGERGPVDYISNCAKFTLSEDKLLAEDINPKFLTLQVTHKDIFENDQKMISITVLECDTITQAKSKMLEMLYKNVGYSQRPSVHKTKIEWLQEDSTARLLSDEDPSSLKDGIWKRINTLEYYGVEDGAKMILIYSEKSDMNLLNAGPGYDDPNKNNTKQIVRTKSGSNFWHLTKQYQSDADEVKIASDILLPRLLVTKGTLQSFVDDLLAEILCVTDDPPIIIKYLFDFLDTAAEDRGITDPEVLHTWKCNSLLLRFWVNIMKNPEFVFDILKPDNVDKCLSVVAQAFMDSCSTADVNLGMGSPSNKLLFARDIPRYKTMVKNYFQYVKDKPAVSDQDLNSYLTEKVSMKFSGNINQSSALMEMYKYAAKYRQNIQNELDNKEAEFPGQYSPMSSKLQFVYMSMDLESNG